MKTGCSAAIKRTKILENAILNNNISNCDIFEDTENIQFCYDNFYLGKRYNEDNQEYCEKIINLELKEECIK